MNKNLKAIIIAGLIALGSYFGYKVYVVEQPTTPTVQVDSTVHTVILKDSSSIDTTK